MPTRLGEGCAPRKGSRERNRSRGTPLCDDPKEEAGEEGTGENEGEADEERGLVGAKSSPGQQGREPIKVTETVLPWGLGKW